jgi:ubiquinone/menaquinone biosynthesis C-methylase UbiE
LLSAISFWLCFQTTAAPKANVVGLEEGKVSEHQIRFEDGAAYERMMGMWSRLAGDVFLDWLNPPPGLRWIDVGCGNGAFTARLIERCAPAEVHGIDPSKAQLAFARTRSDAKIAQFHQGDATTLPFPESRFDAAVMALVIFFVPDPAKGVAAMVRVVAPGGTVAAYAWDIVGGGAPQQPIWAEMHTMDVKHTLPPSVEAARMDTLRDLWINAGLEAVETREITVLRTFADFDDFWTTNRTTPGLDSVIAAMTSDDAERLKARVRERLPADANGRITYAARANAVKGRLPY